MQAGAGDGTRTRNLLITSQLLYQLSYASKSQQNVEFDCLLHTRKVVKRFFQHKKQTTKTAHTGRC